MLNAAEAAMDQTAEDDAERARNRAKLYAPPKGHASTRGRRARPSGAGAGYTRAQAQALARQLAAEDARLAGGRTG